MKKVRLLTPGPTQIPEKILSQFATPILHHRTPQFESIFQSVQKKAQTLFCTNEPVLFLTSSGTGAMEASVSNLFSPHDEVLVLNVGKFGERWSKISKAYNCKVHEIKLNPSDDIKIEDIDKTLSGIQNPKAVLFQAVETSTGTSLPVKEIANLIQKKYPNTLCVVDGITGVGVVPIEMDAWGIDVLITGSQKALMLPPGLALISLSKKAWHFCEQSKNPKFYFDLKKEKSMQSKFQTAWTPAISLICALDEALNLILEEGLESLYLRHKNLAESIRLGIQKLGLKLLSKNPSQAVTAVLVPQEIQDGKKRTYYIYGKNHFSILDSAELSQNLKEIFS